MKATNWIHKLFGSNTSKRSKRGVRDLGDYAENVHLERPESTSGMTVRPSNASSYVEQEFEHYGDEQFLKHEANGVREARPSREQAAAVEYEATRAEERAKANQARFEQVQADHDHAWHWLLPFVRRAPGGHRLYLTWFVLLGLGDAAGVFGAALMWGELVPVALGQALASGAAAVAAGWVGADVRERRDADARARLASSGDLSDDLIGRYPSLFVPTERERSTYELTLAVAVVIVICLASAIFALRAAVEASLLAGVIFGGLAAATALGSFVNSWRHADQVSDLLERYSLRYGMAAGEHERLVNHPAPAERDGSKIRAVQIEAEHQILGLAAKQGVLALQQGVLRRNPHVFGHGQSERRNAPTPVGRKPLRRDDAEPRASVEQPNLLERLDQFDAFEGHDEFQSNGHPPF